MKFQIRTQQKRIPWLWAFFIGLPWVTFGYAERTSAEPITFTLRKFIEDPTLISFISSINILFNFMVGVSAAYLSDRIWTRWGRRKPFFIVSCLGTGVLLFTIPLIGHLWLLIAAIVLYQFFVDLNKPWEPLFNEVIPPRQRGRAGIFRMTLVNLGLLFFSAVLISQFDLDYGVSTPWGTLNGETVLYWSVSLVMFATGAFLLLFVKEESPPPDSHHKPLSYRPSRIPGVLWCGQPGIRFWTGVRTLFAEMFGTRQAVYVYLLYASPILAGTILFHPNYTLFYTEQIGLTKPEYGRMTAIGLGCMIVAFTPLAGFLADRVNRRRMMQFGIAGACSVQAALYAYVLSIGHGTASYPVLLGLYITTSFFLSFVWAVWGPIVYDYVPSNKMGTYQAGIMFTSAMIAFVQTNAGGWWVKGWTAALGTGGSGQNYDHSSILVLAFLIGLVALIPTWLFGRAEKRGEIQPLGRLERE